MRTLKDLIKEQAERPVDVNGLFKRQDDRIKQLEAELAKAHRTIEALRTQYTATVVDYRADV